MVTHPNRSKKNPKAGHNPSPEEIVTARKKAGLTQQRSCEFVYVTVSAWKKWEAGLRDMPPSTWELYLRKALDNGLLNKQEFHQFLGKSKDLSTPEAAAK